MLLTCSSGGNVKSTPRRLSPALEFATDDVSQAHLGRADLGAHHLKASGDILDRLADFLVMQLGGELGALEHG